MRNSTLSSLAALNATSAEFTLMTGETLTVLAAGGSMTLTIEYKAEGLTGAPWVALATSTSSALLVSYPNLPRGVYRTRASAWTSGAREVQLVAN